VYIDGDVWMADAGGMFRYSNGASVGWTAAAPGDALLREAPAYRQIGSGAERRTGTIYGFDPGSDRLIGLSKVNGSFIAQYRLAGGDAGWADFRGFYIEPGIDQDPDAIVWLGKSGIGRALLQPVGALGGAGGSTAPTAAPGS
jgi:hypothetical protein